MIRKTLSATKEATFCVELPNNAKEGMPTPAGTGFLVSPDGGFVTAAHVVTENNERDGPVRADLDQAWLTKESRPPELGAMLQAVSFGHIIAELDVALLKVDFDANANKEWLKNRSEFPYVEISRRNLEEGEEVYSFGYPLSEAFVQTGPGITVGSVSLSPRVTSAIVSSTIEQTEMLMTGGPPKVYVLDKALNYGNSGGPIVSSTTGYVHALCSHFQPVFIPQPYLKDDDGNQTPIMIPSLYGVVTNLARPPLLELLEQLSIPVQDG